jgi:hypothetical protein
MWNHHPTMLPKTWNCELFQLGRDELYSCVLDLDMKMYLLKLPMPQHNLFANSTQQQEVISFVNVL